MRNFSTHHNWRLDQHIGFTDKCASVAYLPPGAVYRFSASGQA
jgi:hypothetical protein